MKKNILERNFTLGVIVFFIFLIAFLLTYKNSFANIKSADKNDVNIDISQHFITISGYSKEEVTEDNSFGSYQSHSYSSFSKTVPIPEDADIDKVKTEIKGDNLIITISKQQ